MNFELSGKRALVTGSTLGIGRAIAADLLREGAAVIINGRDAGRVAEAAKALSHLGEVIGVAADLSNAAGAEALLEEIDAPIDILVNNVGGMIPGTSDGLDEDTWATVLNLNLMSFVYTTKHAIEHLKKSSAGRVLCVSGVTGKQLMPGALTTTIPNTAIHGFAKVMAEQLGKDNITVNTICPGFTATDSWGPRAEGMAKMRGITPDQVREGVAAQTMLGRWAEPKEIGDAAAWIVSEKNSYMTGTIVEVCGGFSRYI